MPITKLTAEKNHGVLINQIPMKLFQLKLSYQKLAR